MTTIQSQFVRDANHVPITYNGITTVVSKTLTGDSATVAVPIFTVTGAIQVTALYAVVTTALGNCTAAYWRLNDGSTQNNVTASTGTDCSNAVTGSMLLRQGVTTTALTLVTAVSAKIFGNALGQDPFQSSNIIANPLATSNIEFVYTTSDAPTTGALTFYIRWAPLGGTVPGELGGTVTSI